MFSVDRMSTRHRKSVRGNRRSRTAFQHQNYRRCHLESLESRQLLASDLDFELDPVQTQPVSDQAPAEIVHSQDVEVVSVLPAAQEVQVVPASAPQTSGSVASEPTSTASRIEQPSAGLLLFRYQLELDSAESAVSATASRLLTPAGVATSRLLARISSGTAEKTARIETNLVQPVAGSIGYRNRTISGEYSAPPAALITRVARFDPLASFDPRWLSVPVASRSELGVSDAIEGDWGKLAWKLERAQAIRGDFDGDQQVDEGRFLAGVWLIDLNHSGVWDQGDVWTRLGQHGDQPLTGDWNGDGKTDIGVYRSSSPSRLNVPAANPMPSEPARLPARAASDVARAVGEPSHNSSHTSRTQIERTSWNQPIGDAVDRVFSGTYAGGVPLVGNWTDSHVDSVGLFDQGDWFLDADGDGELGAPDLRFRMGSAGDLPIVADFDGDGVDEWGIYQDGYCLVDINHDQILDESDLVLKISADGAKKMGPSED